jgi:hypothetical protein
MNAAVFLKKGDVVRIIGFSVNARIDGDWTYFTGHIITDMFVPTHYTIASYNPEAFLMPSPYLPRMKC